MAKKIKRNTVSRPNLPVPTKYNPYNIPRNINTKIRKPMDKFKEFKHIFKKVDKKLYRVTKHKITQPLFIFKLHSHLSCLKQQHLNVFCELTNTAMNFINQKIQEIDKHWRKIPPLYIRKYLAFQMLIKCLREIEKPEKTQIQRIIKCGIYGQRKNKYSKDIKITVQQCMNLYRRTKNSSQI